MPVFTIERVVKETIYVLLMLVITLASQWVSNLQTEWPLVLTVLFGYLLVRIFVYKSASSRDGSAAK